MTVSTPEQFEVVVAAMRLEAPGIVSVELFPIGGGELPTFSAGAHIEVHLPNGQVRSYSLLNAQTDTSRYCIGVALDPRRRGTSKFIVEELRVGCTLRVVIPRNNFPLEESARRSVFIAGGIGITPFRSMIDRLNGLGREWALYYCARTRVQAAFLKEFQTLAARGAGSVHTNFDAEPGGVVLDIDAVIGREGSDVHLYCCGPGGMLETFRQSCRDRSTGHVHFEYFSSDVKSARTGGFEVVLAKSGRRLRVNKGTTILETLRDAGLPLTFSGEQGVCGACETRVLSGVPEHRDQILSDEERASGAVMMICCSGSRSPELVLDL